jgi:hypothetical protein
MGLCSSKYVNQDGMALGNATIWKKTSVRCRIAETNEKRKAK